MYVGHDTPKNDDVIYEQPLIGQVRVAEEKYFLQKKEVTST